MANYFSTRNNNSSKKDELRKALAAIRIEEDAAHEEYLHSVRETITRHPNLTAQQYANMLADNAEERNSIKISIGVMGAMADEARNYKNSEICKNPSLPSLTRKHERVKRRFIEIDENNNPLGTMEIEECKTTYYME